MKKYWLVLLPLALAGCSHTDKNQQAGADPLNVQTEKVMAYSGTEHMAYSGVAEARQNTPLSFANTGTITEIVADEGDAVAKGQLLAKLNTVSAENAYQLALQKQDQAQDAYTRMKPMKENGTIPDIKWVELETGLNQAKAATGIAKKGLADCNLYAPEAGVIGKKNISPGMNMIPGVTAFELLDIQSLYIKIPVPEDEIKLFKKGNKATVSVGALSRSLGGTVREIGVSADMLSHTYPVKIEIPNADHAIMPGMVCSVSLDAQNDSTGFLVSSKTLQQDMHGTQFVLVNENNKVQKRAVKTILLIGPKVLVKGNLKEGDEIIISGQDKLHAGDTINAIN